MVDFISEKLQFWVPEIQIHAARSNVIHPVLSGRTNISNDHLFIRKLDFSNNWKQSTEWFSYERWCWSPASGERPLKVNCSALRFGLCVKHKNLAERPDFRQKWSYFQTLKTVPKNLAIDIALWVKWCNLREKMALGHEYL